MRRAIPILVVVVGIVALAFWPKENSGSNTPPDASRPHLHEIENRIPKLKKQIAEQEVESAQALAKYAPKSQTRIDDLGSPVTDLLRQVAGVVQVDVGVEAKKPTSRIVHLRDWHSVPKEHFAIDMKQAHARELATEEIDRLHQELLLEVELVQIEQMVALRCLIKPHGLKKVFSEGFSPEELTTYREKIAVLRGMENEQIPQLRTQLEETRKLVEGATGDKKEKAEAIQSQLVTMLDEHKHRLLEMGAAGRLLISGELEDVLPLEDADAMQKAKPISPSGGVEVRSAET